MSTKASPCPCPYIQSQIEKCTRQMKQKVEQNDILGANVCLGGIMACEEMLRQISMTSAANERIEADRIMKQERKKPRRQAKRQVSSVATLENRSIDRPAA